MSRKDLSLRAIFAAPLVLFIVSLIGLIGSLLDDGLWNWLAPLCLGATVVVTAWALVCRKR